LGEICLSSPGLKSPSPVTSSAPQASPDTSLNWRSGATVRAILISLLPLVKH
jgi:hypothetical protein